ncbi:Hypothetical protein R9X50_00420600 [Acrodontium crateriforme]|uniref:P-loop containing nucleoside triphosphate hydrolase protein n=1 Tax=Acrodontium crateriforme TaxID=150365 RepID=A0AAQ3R869_9PEZI|nr:Hypothetical protein R9X50_00420600 [Acrodontium crateriforme]
MATQADFDRIGNYARMYNNDQNIDRRKSQRTVPLEVLALGYSRTGTLSMRETFKILGYPNPYHFSSFYDNVKDCDIWAELIGKKFEGRGTVTKKDFDGLLGHCGAVTDMPCHLFAAELIEFYPDAKVVLVERDIDSWYKSWSDFLDNAFNPTLPLLGRFDPYFLGRIVKVGVLGVDKQVGGAHSLKAAKARSKEEYRKHYALVRSLVSKERILEYRLGDGWEPLCKFLGKPIPAKAFPHVNDSASNGQSFKELAEKALKRIATSAALGLTPVAVLAATWYYRKKRA